jgi:hypothetical protein
MMRSNKRMHRTVQQRHHQRGREITDYVLAITRAIDSQLASKNHGWAGRKFVKRILEKRAEDEQELLTYLEAKKNIYLDRAKKQMQLSGGKTRIHDKFATVFAAGCLAIREEILPFTINELGNAILKCEKNHMKYVGQELAEIAQSQQAPIECLRAYIKQNRHTFIDLKKSPPSADHDYKSAAGYTNVHKGCAEFLISDGKLDKIMGGKWVTNPLKKELLSQGLISTAWKSNGQQKYVARRSIGPRRRTDWLLGFY